MEVSAMFAVVATSNMELSEEFYTKLFSQPPTDRPMESLIQWRDVAGAGLQVVYDKDKAGKSQITLVTPQMDKTRKILKSQNLELGSDIEGDYGIIAQIEDPDGNCITLAEPPKM